MHQMSLWGRCCPAEVMKAAAPVYILATNITQTLLAHLVESRYLDDR